jgi:hypothetical protein
VTATTVTAKARVTGRWVPLLAGCVLSGVVSVAFADPVYKCTEGGRTTYADRPCATGRATELPPPPVGIRPEGAESVPTRDARTLLELEKLRIAREREQERAARADARQARADATRRKTCARLALRRKRAEEDVARAHGRARAAAERRLTRARDALAVECPA